MLGLYGLPANAAPAMQLTPFPSPTPGPDGRIIYIVQEGDTLWRVSAITGIPLDDLRELNNLGENDIITPNQELLLGLGGPSAEQPTVGPEPTPTSVLPTPTPGIGTGMLCIVLYEDVNGDAMRQEEEPSIPGGAISIQNRAGTIAMTEDTVTSAAMDDPETLDIEVHQCFDELEQGDYNVTVAIPDGYNATTSLNYPIVLNAGDESYLDFGAQPNSEMAADAPLIPTEGDQKSPTLVIVGGLLLLGGVALGIYANFLRRA